MVNKNDFVASESLFIVVVDRIESSGKVVTFFYCRMFLKFIEELKGNLFGKFWFFISI